MTHLEINELSYSSDVPWDRITITITITIDLNAALEKERWFQMAKKQPFIFLLRIWNNSLIYHHMSVFLITANRAEQVFKILRRVP